MGISSRPRETLTRITMKYMGAMDLYKKNVSFFRETKKSVVWEVKDIILFQKVKV